VKRGEGGKEERGDHGISISTHTLSISLSFCRKFLCTYSNTISHFSTLSVPFDRLLAHLFLSNPPLHLAPLSEWLPKHSSKPWRNSQRREKLPSSRNCPPRNLGRRSTGTT
jgi:hypothetical protein